MNSIFWRRGKQRVKKCILKSASFPKRLTVDAEQELLRMQVALAKAPTLLRLLQRGLDEMQDTLSIELLLLGGSRELLLLL